VRHIPLIFGSFFFSSSYFSTCSPLEFLSSYFNHWRCFFVVVFGRWEILTCFFPPFLGSFNGPSSTLSDTPLPKNSVWSPTWDSFSPKPLTFLYAVRGSVFLFRLHALRSLLQRLHFFPFPRLRLFFVPPLPRTRTSHTLMTSQPSRAERKNSNDLLSFLGERKEKGTE